MEFDIRENKDSACIYLLDGHDVAGFYELYSNEYADNIVVTSYMQSFAHGKGVPKKLIKKTSEYLKVLANKRNKTVKHCVYFENIAAKEKLSHIFKENGYIQFPGWEYEKSFFPEKKEFDEKYETYKYGLIQLYL